MLADHLNLLSLVSRNTQRRIGSALRREEGTVDEVQRHQVDCGETRSCLRRSADSGGGAALTETIMRLKDRAVKERSPKWPKSTLSYEVSNPVTSVGARGLARTLRPSSRPWLRLSLNK